MKHNIEETDFLKQIFLTRVQKQNNLRCPGCQKPASSSYFPTSDRKVFYCRNCLRTVAPLGGTIFQNTKLPLKKWLDVTADVLEKGNKLQAKELSIDYNLSLRSSYRMLAKINRWKQQNNILKRIRNGPRRYRTEKYILFELILQTMPPLFSNHKSEESAGN